MSYLQPLRLAIAGRRPGSKISIDHVRRELEAAQVPPSQYGGLFAEAVRKGLLTWHGETTRSTYRPAKGRRICVYRVAVRRRGELTQPTLLEGIAS